LPNVAPVAAFDRRHVDIHRREPRIFGDDGPGRAPLATYPRFALVFVGAMMIGMALFHLADRLSVKLAPA